MSDKAEVEAKIYVPDLAAVAGRIEAAGGHLEAARVYEYNVRYDRPGGELARQLIVLRLRKDTRVRLTYKGPATLEAGIMSRREAEVTVDDFETMDFILRSLGFEPVIVYEKYRTTYRLGEAEIVLDEMPYGNFVEIEAPAPVILRLVSALGLADYPRIATSYLGIFAYLKQRLGLAFRDVTFDNFRGVAVPADVFEALT